MKSAVLRGSDIRNRNEKIILYNLFSRGTASQSETVTVSGLRPPTVLRIFNSLQERGLIEPLPGKAPTGDRKGRRPVEYRIRPEAYFSIGVWIEHDKVVVVLSDFLGHENGRSVLTRDAYGCAFEAGIADHINSLLDQQAITAERILGIGVCVISAFHTVFEENRTETMHDIDRETLERITGVPVSVWKAGSLLAGIMCGESRLPAEGTVIFLFIDSVVHAGITVAGGENKSIRDPIFLDLGKMAVAGSTGTETDLGCLEDYISDKAFLKALRPEGNIQESERLEELVRVDPVMSRKLLEDTGGILATALYSLHRLIDPSVFIIGTRSPSMSHLLTDIASSRFESIRGGHGRRPVFLQFTLDAESAAMTCAALILEMYFQS